MTEHRVVGQVLVIARCPAIPNIVGATNPSSARHAMRWEKIQRKA